MGNGSDERDERGRHGELNHDCVTRRRRATNIFKVLSSFEGSQYQLRHLDSRGFRCQPLSNRWARVETNLARRCGPADLKISKLMPTPLKSRYWPKISSC
jgi:hypothetical protein